jgi:hypothetical protein
MKFNYLASLLFLICFSENSYCKNLDLQSIPADHWSFSKIYEFKNFLVFPIDPGSLSIKFEDSSENKWELNSNYNISLNGKKICSLNTSTSSKNANFKCGYQFCESVTNESQKEDVFLDPMSQMVDSFKKECSTNHPIFYVANIDKDFKASDNKFIFIPVLKRQSSNSFEISFSNNSKIINPISIHPEYVSKHLSEIEKLEENLARHKKAKDLPVLNNMISDLLPCVKKRDGKCTEKFFLSDEELSKEDISVAFGDFERGGGYKKQVIDEEAFKELEACLSYSSLLPHLKALKGINKVCVFVDRPSSYPRGINRKFDHITYPEAIRSKITNEFFYVKK